MTMIVFEKLLAFMVCSLKKGWGDTILVILYHDFFDKLLEFEIFYYCSIVDYAIDMSEYSF